MASSTLATPKKRARSKPDCDEEPDKWAIFQAKKSAKTTAIRQDSISQLLQEFNDEHLNDEHNDQNDLTQEVDFVEPVADNKKVSLKVVDTVKYNAARIELLKAEFYEAEDY
jgi:hypothetical protein